VRHDDQMPYAGAAQGAAALSTDYGVEAEALIDTPLCRNCSRKHVPKTLVAMELSWGDGLANIRAYRRDACLVRWYIGSP
jgi:hypothetical protein